MDIRQDDFNGTLPVVMGPSPPNYGGIKLVASIWSMWFVASAFLGARCYCKFRRHMGLWWDDGILIAAWVGFHEPIRRSWEMSFLINDNRLASL